VRALPDTVAPTAKLSLLGTVAVGGTIGVGVAKALPLRSLPVTLLAIAAAEIPTAKIVANSNAYSFFFASFFITVFLLCNN
jgi:hypothetical protein